MGVRQEVKYPVLLAQRQHFIVGFEGGVALSVGKHHAFRHSCGAAGVEDVHQVVILHLAGELLHLGLTGHIVAEIDEIVEVDAYRVVGGNPDIAVEDNDFLKRRTYCEQMAGFVILLLFAGEDEAYTGIVHHKLHLLLA